MTKAWKIRLSAMVKCLRQEHFILICWRREPDGDNTFFITHKGVRPAEAVHRLKVDAAEIMQDIADQNSALDEVDRIIKPAQNG